MRILIILLVACWAPSASAAVGLELDNTVRVICSIYNIVHDQIAYYAATFSIVVLGIMCFFDRMNWGQFFIVIVGIVMAYGAMPIALSLTGTSRSTCTGDTNYAFDQIPQCRSTALAGACSYYRECPEGTALESDECELCTTLHGSYCVREPQEDNEIFSSAINNSRLTAGLQNLLDVVNEAREAEENENAASREEGDGTNSASESEDGNEGEESNSNGMLSREYFGTSFEVDDEPDTSGVVTPNLNPYGP